MKFGQEGYKLLKEFEGCELKAYPDPGTGGEPWTIGYGHTSAAGEPKVHKGLIITQEQADEILSRDIQKYEKAVIDHAGPEFTQNQFDAMTSLCYNIGPGNFKTSSVAKQHKAGQYEQAAKSFLKWNKAGGKVMKGLTRRREAEKSLYLKEDNVNA